MSPHALFDGGLLEARVIGIGIDKFINLEVVRSMENVLRFEVLIFLVASPPSRCQEEQ